MIIAIICQLEDNPQRCFNFSILKSCGAKIQFQLNLLPN
jgi:hypothetical protein